ncbi:MAG: hypothetical protein KatS3mg065_1266 [Chloroflexota bacterium]|nr:MAG: hypothetical protein KatS3mg065_1266 [Chloroflexota bacterium]
MEEEVEAGLPVAGAALDRVRSARGPVAVGEVGVIDGARERLVGRPVDLLGARQGHRLGRPAVEAVSEGDDGRPPRGDPGELDGGLDGLGPAVREEDAPWPPGEERGEAGVEAEAGLVEDDVLLAVDELRRLGGDGGGDPGVGVAGVRDADPRRVVEVALPIDGDEPRALASLDDEVGDPGPDGRHDGPIGERFGPAGAGRRPGRGGWLVGSGVRFDHRGFLLVARPVEARPVRRSAGGGAVRRTAECSPR